MEDITQKLADSYIKMEKFYLNERPRSFPVAGTFSQFTLVSMDKHCKFYLTINRKGKLIKMKCSFQTRSYNHVPLVRLDLFDRTSHWNPDGRHITGSHVHLYKEGYRDMYAYPLAEVIPSLVNSNDLLESFKAFCEYCHIESNFKLQAELF